MPHSPTGTRLPARRTSAGGAAGPPELTPNLAQSRLSPSGSAATPDELEALLHAVRQGCHPSFARFYALTSPLVFGAVLRINHDRAEAEELLQEVYVLAWSRCAQFDASKGHAIYWLLGIARHSAISSLRRRGARPQRPFPAHATDEDPVADLPCADPGPLELVISTRDAEAVRSCLRALDSEHRECLTLAYYDGLTHEEIGRRMGRPLGTVKTWLRRSLITLRAALTAHR